MFSFASKTNDPNARLRWNERIGYGIGNFGMATVNGLMSGFFMKYLTDVSLYDAAAISTIIAVSKLFDGFSDILMGRIVDKTHSKLGKARIWLLTMCIPLAIVSVLLFSTPSGLSGFAKYAYLFIIYNLVNTVFQQFASVRPIVLPQQRTDSQSAAACKVEVGFKVARHLLNTFFNNVASEVARTHNAVVSGNHHTATAL